MPLMPMPPIPTKWIGPMSRGNFIWFPRICPLMEKSRGQDAYHLDPNHSVYPSRECAELPDCRCRRSLFHDVAAVLPGWATAIFSFCALGQNASDCADLFIR